MQIASCIADIGRLEGQKIWATWQYKVVHLLGGCAGGLDVMEGKLIKPIQARGTNRKI